MMSIIDINRGKTYYTILERPDWAEPIVMYRTENLDEAIHWAKEQYGPLCMDNHAYVVLADRWDSGDHTILVDVLPDPE